jgi:apolipoprotein N-acyltransferase
MITEKTESLFIQKQKLNLSLCLGLILLTLISAVILTLALPNELFYYGNPVLGFICLTAYYLALTYSPSFRFASLLGVIFGASTTFLVHYWLLFYGEFSIWTISGVALGYMGYHALFAPILFGLIRFDFKHKAFVIALAWTFYEFLKSSGFLGFPWGILPHTVAPIKPFIQIVDIAGIWGLSFIVAFINALFAEVVIFLRHRTLFSWVLPTKVALNGVPFVPKSASLSLRQLAYSFSFAGVLVVLALGYGFWILGQDFAPQANLQVLLVQPNEDPWASFNEELVLNRAMWLTSQGLFQPAKGPADSSADASAINESGPATLRYKEMQRLKQQMEAFVSVEDLTLINKQAKIADTIPASTTLKRPDLVIWSETSFPYYIKEERFEATIQNVPQPVTLHDLIKQTGAHFIIGAAFKSQTGHDYQNGALLISPTGELVNHYGKQHPVPIAESIPFWEFKLIREFFQNNLGLTSSGWEQGKTYTLFQIPVSSSGGTKSLTFGIPICFEDSFPYLSRNFVAKGADFLVNITNVSWSKQKSAEIQMYVASIFRSIENRRVLIRSTNGGVTSIIDPKGEVLRELELFVPDTLYADVPIYSNSSLTIYTQWGDYLPILCAFILLCFIGWKNFLILRKKILVKNSL